MSTPSAVEPATTSTHEVLDPDATRYDGPGQPPTVGSLPTGIPPGVSGPLGRHVQMLVAGQTLGSRYHIIRLLGAGGMGAVYHAWDAELGVAVALKLILTSPADDPGALADMERLFKQELLNARKVTHKNVVRIHDMGEVDGIKYISMPYVQGDDLASILRKEGKLPIARTLKYVAQIVDGLVAAHEKGVVHRDLKPANIMIDEEDQPLIMDFGIARSGSKTGSSPTKVVGTLAYMSPEQARAKPTDHRADIYSLGMMMREMLVGRAAARDGEEALADMMQRCDAAPAALRTYDDAIPEPLDALVSRCVQPTPDDRFQTTAELKAAVAALDEDGHRRPVPKTSSPWWMAGAAAVVVGAIGVSTYIVRVRTPEKPIDPVSILVADFDNRTGDAVFDGALEPPLTIAMEGASFIRTFGRSDAQQLARTLKGAPRLDDATARLVAFRQGVKYVIAGEVATKGGGFTLQLRAVEPANGAVFRTVSADARSKADVLGAIVTLASRVRSALGDKAADAAKPGPAETFTAGSLEAFREYTTAQDLALARRDLDAVAHYRRAIELDPKFGRAYSGLAIIAQRLGNADEADAAWKTALSLIDRMTDREKYRTLGSYYLGTVRNYEKAAENYAALVAAYPGDDAGFGNLALSHFYLHDFTKALEEVRRAVAINPGNMIQRNNLALYAMYAGDFPAAAGASRAIIKDNAATASTFLPLVMDAVSRNDTASAALVYDDMQNVEPPRGASIASMGRADLALYTGRLAAADAELKAGIAADLNAKAAPAAALKQVMLAEELIDAGRKPQAVDAAHAALKATHQPSVLVPAARVLIQAGRTAEARGLAAELEGQLQKQDRAYGQILTAEIAIADKNVPQAIDLLTESKKFADLWLGRFDLGVAYVQVERWAEAQPELEACWKRRGEATALFFDDRPTARYLASLPYWMGRAEEGLQMASAKSRFDSFIELRKDATADPLVPDARRRAAAR